MHPFVYRTVSIIFIDLDIPKLPTKVQKRFVAFLGLPAGPSTYTKKKKNPKAHFTHSCIYAYLPLFMGSWNMHEYWDSEDWAISWLGDGRICGGFSPLLAPRFIEPKKCIF